MGLVCGGGRRGGAMAGRPGSFMGASTADGLAAGGMAAGPRPMVAVSVGGDFIAGGFGCCSGLPAEDFNACGGLIPCCGCGCGCGCG